jgi:hypothetical protein
MIDLAVGAHARRLASVLSVCAWAAPAWSQTPPRPPDVAEDAETPEDIFEQESLSLVVVGTGPTSTAADDTSPWRPVRGKYRWKMSYADFYTSVGRPDLAAAQSRRDVTSGVLVLGGLAVALGGLFFVVRGLGGGDGFTTEAGVGVGLVAGGGVACLVGASMAETVISAGEAQRLAASHNEALRVRLGLPADVESSRPRAPSPFPFRLAVMPQPWAVSLSGEF